MPWVALVGAGISAAGMIQQGQASEAAAEFDAKVKQQQAERERQVSKAREGDFRRQQSAAMGRRRALSGASGVDFSTGSPLFASNDFAREVELQALRLRSGGQTSASRLEDQANLSQTQGANLGRAGYTRAGASLLSGAGDYYSMRR